jgi:hypothetical protein
VEVGEFPTAVGLALADTPAKPRCPVWVFLSVTEPLGATITATDGTEASRIDEFPQMVKIDVEVKYFAGLALCCAV